MAIRLNRGWQVFALCLVFVIAASLGCAGRQPCLQDAECAQDQVCLQGSCILRTVVEATPEAPPQELQPEPIKDAGAHLEPPIPPDAPPQETRHTEPQRGDTSAPDKDTRVPEDTPEDTWEAPPEDTAPCQEGTRRPCYSGPASSKGIGECLSGIQFCDAKGAWGGCRNQITPQPEICDGKDNDCNGQIDEGLRAAPCTLQQGVCQGARQVCDGPKGWRLCDTSIYQKHNGAYEEQEQTCDGKDNDCDGSIDLLSPLAACSIPGATSICAEGHGVCTQQGQRVCQPVYKAAAQEICHNQLDDNCDGQIDETTTCPLFALPRVPEGLAINQAGTAFMVNLAQNITGQCIDKQGKEVRKSFLIDPFQDLSNVGLSRVIGIWHLPVYDRFLVAWEHNNIYQGAVPYGQYGHFQLFDKQCQPIGTRQTLGFTQSAIDTFIEVVAVGADGTFAMITPDATGAFQLTHFDHNGKAAATKLLVLGPPAGYPAQSSNPDMSLAFNANGQGVIVYTHKITSSQGHSIRYRRLDISKMAFVDSQWQSIPAAPNTHIYSNQVAIDAKGAFHIGWEVNIPYLAPQNHHAFIDATGTKQTFVALPDVGLKSIKPMLFRNDFVWGTSGTSTYWYRYKADGTTVARQTAPLYMASISPSQEIYGVLKIGAGTFLQPNAITLAPARLCGGKFCVCQPYKSRDCNTDLYLPLLTKPCRAGRQVCRPDGLSWGPCQGEILRSAEVCQDNIDNDCDGQIDEGCTSFDTLEPPRVNDYDVAADGSAMAIHWNGRAVRGACYRPDRSVLRGSFPISQPIQGKYPAYTLRVLAASNNQYWLVSWNEASNGPLLLRLFDVDCMPLTPILHSGSLHTGVQPNGKYTYTTAINEQGDFALLGRDIKSQSLQLHLYARANRWQGKHYPVDPTQQLCLGSNNNPAILLHPTDGTGRAICQDRSKSKFHMRRFSFSQGFLDAALSPLAPHVPPVSARWRQIATATNQQGAFVIAWNNGASFFDAKGTFIKQVKGFSPIASNDDKRDVTDRIALWGDDFVLRDGSQGKTTTWYRFSPTGVRKSKATYTAPKATWADLYPSWRHSLRIGNDKSYLMLESVGYREQIKIRIGSLRFQ